MTAPVANHAKTVLTRTECREPVLQLLLIPLRKQVRRPTAVLRVEGLKILDDGDPPVARRECAQ